MATCCRQIAYNLFDGYLNNSWSFVFQFAVSKSQLVFWLVSTDADKTYLIICKIGETEVISPDVLVDLIADLFPPAVWKFI